MIFRWSIWGEDRLKNIELLRYSILSFKKQFGNTHQYILYTDDSRLVSKQLGLSVDVRTFPSKNESPFCINSKATWLKWCPSPRLDISQDEFFVDSDVFLLKYPEEIDSALSDAEVKFVIMDEFKGQPYQHGAMHKRDTKNTPYVNAGFFLQKARYDISSELIKEFDWWKKKVKSDEQTHHDEQGALAIVLTKYAINNQLVVLPKSKYMIISETSNTNIKNLDNVTLFHATYPTHPAFYKFRQKLDEILHDELKSIF